MLLDSVQFKAMESGIKAMNIKQQVHTQNLANLDTPDYKTKTFSFKSSLADACETKEKIHGKNSQKYSFEAVIGERDATDVLIDGNNVDEETESLELYSAYIQQSAIIQKMNAVISDYRYVLTNANFK